MSKPEVLDIALSSRVRLARNIAELPFPNRMTKPQMEALADRVLEALGTNSGLMLLRMGTLPERERRLLVERHLISPGLAANDAGAAFVNKEETVSIMIAEEDHLRIQCLEPGLNLVKADQACTGLDAAIGKTLPFAFSPELGFLTACPTNLGSAMRASVMLHLPALSLMGQVDALLATVSKLGYAVRGIYGEGSGAPGHIYQISNQLTLGLLEEDILGNLQATVAQIMERERSLRVPLYQNNRVELEDRIFRSLGTLRYAHRLSTAEAMECLSDLKLGTSIGLLPEEAHRMLNRLLTDVQGAMIEQRAGEGLNAEQRDQVRAAYTRKEIQTIEAMYQEAEKRGELE